MKFKTILSYDNIVFTSVWLLLFVVGRDKLFRDPGTFFHTVIGEKILNTGYPPCEDIFSFTRFGEPWIAKQWLAECIMAVVHRLAGFDGLLVLSVSLIALLYSLLASRIERSGMNLMLGSFILVFSLATASHNLHVRPHIVTILLMAVVFSKLIDLDMQRMGYWKLYWLIPIFIIWANIHGGVLGGLCTLLLIVAGWTLASWRGWNCPVPPRKFLAGLWVLTTLCLITPLLNPYLHELPVAWVKIMGSKATAELIEENASVLNLLRHGDPTSFITVAIVSCLGLFYFSLLAGTDKKDRRVTWYIPLIWFLLSLSRIRHAPLFSVVTVITIAEMFPYCRWVKFLGNRGLITFQIRNEGGKIEKPSRLRYILPALIVGVALIACQGSAKLPSTAQKWVKLDPDHWPVEVLPELRAIEKEVPKGTPLFNDMIFGGFLIYHTPCLRVFIDDRCELYEDDFLFRYVKAERSDFEAWTKQYPFDIALLKIDSNYRKYFDDDPNWLVVKRCRAAVLYRKFIP